MARKSNQKLKLLYLSRIFMEKTDESHGLSLNEIISLLQSYDIPADRKTLYQDFEELRQFGLDIISDQQGRHVYYRLASRDFELAELKLLVDSVQSAKFITENKSRTLIKKLESLVSVYDASKLQRQVLISGRVKTMNESILINVDLIHTAIHENRKISFQYFQWTPEKKRELRHNGLKYIISPWYLIWDDENYYLVGYDSNSDMIKHYRVDKMLKITETEEKREGQKKLKELDLAAYTRRLFGMLGGETEHVTLTCKNGMAGIIIDRFGRDTIMIPGKEGTFTAHVDVIPSQQFLGWIIGLGPGVRITSPENVVAKLQTMIREQASLYLGSD